MHDGRRPGGGVDAQVQRHLAGRLQLRLHRRAVELVHPDEAGGQFGVVDAARRHHHEVAGPRADVARGSHHQPGRGQLQADPDHVVPQLFEQHRFDGMDTPDVLAWREGHIEALDQTALPHQVRVLRITTVDQLVEAITTLAVRGAPVLGAAGALGVALAVHQGDREGWDAGAAGRGGQADRRRPADRRQPAPRGGGGRGPDTAGPRGRRGRGAGRGRLRRRGEPPDQPSAAPPTSGTPAAPGGSAFTRTATPGAWPAWAGARRSG